MRISILGGFELSGPRGTIRLTARRQHIVLATLVWQANRVVAIESLIDALWGAAPPDTARSQVHICVSGIRKRLARGGVYGLVSTEPPGYLARVGAGELDLRVFDDLVGHARSLMAQRRWEEASRCLGDARALWRGDPFPGVDSERVRSMAAQLVERHLSASEDHFRLLNRLGRSPDVVGEAMALVARFPFRERLRHELMVALCHTGRQAEALREYRDARELFVDELGVEPGRALRRLAREILDDRMAAPV